jgi:hypothetical protein
MEDSLAEVQPDGPPHRERTILVLANLTATSDDLLAALRRRAGERPTWFSVVLPADAAHEGRAEATERLRRVLDRLREAGLGVDGRLGDGDPAVAEAWDPRRYDEILVATLPIPLSRWLHAGLPQRIAQMTGAPVTHEVCRQPPLPVPTAPAPPQHKYALGPLSVLLWGTRRHHPHGALGPHGGRPSGRP